MSVWSKLGLHVNNTDEIPEPALEAIAVGLLGIDQLEPKLGQRAVCHVVDGSDEGVLDVLRRTPAAASRLQLGALYGFGAWSSIPPAPLVRLGRVLIAVSGRHHPLGSPKPAPAWFVALHPLLVYGQRELDALRLADVLEAGGETGALVLAVFASPGWWTPRRRVAEVAGRYADTVAEWLAEGVEMRDALFPVLSGGEIDPTPFLTWIALDAVSSSKRRRRGVFELLTRAGEAVRPELERLATRGSVAQRREAYQRLAELFGDDARGFLERRVEAEAKSAKNRSVLEVLLARAQASSEPEVGPELPPLSPVPQDVPLPEGYRAHLIGVLDRWQKRAVCAHESCQSTWAGRRTEPPFYDQALVDRFLTFVRDGVAPPRLPGRGQRMFNLFVNAWVDPATVASLVRCDGLHAVHLFRVFAGLGFFGAPPHLQPGAACSAFRAFRRAHDGFPNLRELASIAAANGWQGAAVGQAYLRQESWNPGFDYRPEEAWSYFAERPGELRSAIQGPVGQRPNALAALACFPTLPRELSELAWKAAFDTAKAVRPYAQAALSNAPNKLTRIVAALGDGTQGVRANAADWLGRLGDERAVEPLTRALKKEKSDLAKGAMFKALEALGVDLGPYLDRDGLQREALKKLKRGVPPKLAWFPFDALPQVRWKSDGVPVARESLTWLLATAHKLKSAEPSPLLRLYGQHWDGAEALGDYVLDAWLAEDTRVPTRAELEPKARQQAKQWARWNTDQSEDELFEVALQGLLAQPSGSAQAHRGILAFAAAFGGASVAPKIERYLKDWYGMRAAQCKTLLQVLAQRDDDHAIAVLLATATRFRTKGIRKEAEVQVQQLAERRGWTPAELADRTVPTAGFVFDAEARRAVLRLDMGPRELRAVLDDELRVVLDKGEGKLAKSFPKPRKDDDPEKAAAAKKVFSAAKKKIKGVVRMQGDRLYEAMCTGHGWDVASWGTYLERHPIVGRLCERTVWAAFRGDALVVSFRPLGDGTLTDVDDEPVELDDDLIVRVAHDSNLGAELAARWREHLADYEVTPLFSQLGAEPFELEVGQRDDLSLRSFEGHIVDAFTLRGKLTKLGYARGETQDGGWFYAYTRSFPTLHLQAVVNFSGSPLPEVDRPVALMGITFTHTSDTEEVGGAGGLPLGDVPPVLLSEVYHHVSAVAALGAGFDPDWESRTYG